MTRGNAGRNVKSATLGGGLAAALFHGLSAGRDCLDDVMVASTAAEISFELVPNGRVVEVVALAVNHVERRHDHAGSAIAALQSMMLAEGLLHGMQRPVGVRHAF